jgi:hypothetical protein
MREIFKYGSVGRALGDQCLYPEDGRLRFLRIRVRKKEPKYAHPK